MGTRKVRCPTCRKLTRYENKPTIRYGKLAACDDCYARAKAVREGEPPYGPMARVLQWYFDGTLRPIPILEVTGVDAPGVAAAPARDAGVAAAGAGELVP